MNSTNLDAVELTARLIRCQSVTPAEGGAIELLNSLFGDAGFRCMRCDRNGVANLFARYDGPADRPVFGFNGHTDVVPPGDAAGWTHPPFSGRIVDGFIWGRGAADMKSGVAAFTAAAIEFVRHRPEAGSVVVTVTGDEEATATDGTVAILDWMRAHGERMDVCLVGEPTCPSTPGEMIKIGRRGSMNITFDAEGKQGHSAYPERARNAAAAIARLADEISREPLDNGSESFSPSTLAVTGIDTGNPAANVIPGQCRAKVNIRFNDLHTSAELTERLRRKAESVAAEFDLHISLETQVSGESFLTPPGGFSDLVVKAVESVTGRVPELSTSGGTSDARFIREHCPVVEYGLVGATMHQTDERVALKDIRELKETYLRILDAFFA